MNLTISQAKLHHCSLSTEWVYTFKPKTYCPHIMFYYTSWYNPESWLVDVTCSIRDSQWICLCHALLRRSDRIHMHTERNLRWLCYKMFWVLNYMVITVDHCTLTHSRSIMCYLLSIAILIDLSWLNLLQKYRCLSVQFIFSSEL